MARAITYTRFSTPEQMLGHSQQRQDDDIRRFAKEHSLNIDEKFTFKDVGISGHRGEHRKRGALGDFLKAVDKGLVRPGEWLLIEDFDRLSREEPLEALELFRKIVRAGITIATVSDRQVFDQPRLKREPTCLFVVLGKMIRANEESTTKSTRVHAAWHAKQTDKQKRLVTTGSRSIPWWLKVEDGEFVPIKEKVALVNEIFRLSANGMGRHAIIRELSSRGIKAPRGGSWNNSTIGQLLMRDQVLGVYQPMSKVGGKKRSKASAPVVGYYPRVVTPKLVAEARAAVAARRTAASTGPKGTTFNNLFVGIVFCACGAPIWFRDRGKKGGMELVCSAHYGGRGDCDRTGFNYAKFEGQFRDHVAEVDLANLESGRLERYAALRDEIAALGIEAQQKRTEAQRLMDAVRLENIYAPPMVMTTITRLEKEAELAEVKQREKQVELEGKSGRPAKASLKRLKRIWPKDDYEARAALSAEIRRVVAKIVFDGHSRSVAVYLVDDVGYFVIDGRLLARYRRSDRVVRVEAMVKGAPVQLLVTPPDAGAGVDWSVMHEHEVDEALEFVEELLERGVDLAALSARQVVEQGGPNGFGGMALDEKAVQVALNKLRRAAA